MKLSFLLGIGIVATLGLIEARPGQTACLSTGDSGSNKCLTFDGATSTATQQYSTSNLTSNSYFQLGFYSSNGQSYSISNVEYAQNNTSYSTLGSGSINTGSSLATNYFSAVSFAPTPIGVPFYVRYTINGPVPSGVTITSRLLTNDNNASASGVLTGGGNNFADIQRDSTVPVPAPLPILGAAAAFARVKRFRRNSKILSSMV
jgi:hypothetical protein